ncbi:hypothetical protein C0V73_07020 [Rhizobium sp. TH135]|nr:hypothetical protein C0V73_07020 [Rhizobium sp. TH135]
MTFGPDTGCLRHAVRHGVENLIRRRNICFWRPRIPAKFFEIASAYGDLPDGHRLSDRLSLRDGKM